MEKYQQFKFRQDIPGKDHGGPDCYLAGKPSALKDVLEDIASALGFLDPDYLDIEVAAGYLNEALKRHDLGWEGALKYYGLEWGRVSSPGTKGLKYQQFKLRKGTLGLDFDIDRLYVGPPSALKLVLAEIERALFQFVEVSDFGKYQDEVQEGADILIEVLERYGLAWEGETSPTPVIEEPVR